MLMRMKQDAVAIGGLRIDYLIDNSATQGIGLFELTVAPQSVVPPAHSHADNDEYIYVLSGKLRYSVDGETRDLGPGECMESDRGSVHGFSNPFDEPARALIVQSPDIGRQYFVDIGEVLGVPGPPDRAKIGAIMAQYKLQVAAPPAH
jgi:quercetin dioxygenase-like cupin family protein